jgi:hypothetical protein
MRGHLVFVPLQLGADQAIDAHLTTGVNDPSVSVANADMRDLASGIGKKGDVILTHLVQCNFFPAFELL